MPTVSKAAKEHRLQEKIMVGSVSADLMTQAMREWLGTSFVDTSRGAYWTI